MEFIERKSDAKNANMTNIGKRIIVPCQAERN